MRSSGDDWCVYYAGFYDRTKPLEKRTHCNAGVEYASVETKIEYTYCNFGDRSVYGAKSAHPCFKRQAHLTHGCPKARYYTLEELAARHAESDKSIRLYSLVRAAIISHLNGAKGGAGTIDCPACKTGTVRYSRAECNGHVHARCSTEGCVSWME